MLKTTPFCHAEPKAKTLSFIVTVSRYSLRRVLDRSFAALPRNSLRGSAAQRTARRLCRSQHRYHGRAVCFCLTRQSHVTSLRGGFLVDGAVAEGRVGVKELSRNSLRGSAAQRPARRLCSSQHLYHGRAVCFCLTRQSHVTSL